MQRTIGVTLTLLGVAIAVVGALSLGFGASPFGAAGGDGIVAAAGILAVGLVLLLLGLFLLLRRGGRNRQPPGLRIQRREVSGTKTGGQRDDQPERRVRELELSRRLGSPDRNLAQLRLHALEAIRPPGDRLPPSSLIEGQAHVLTGTVSGKSNWLQLGPSAMPNTTSLDRTVSILASGRVTGIAVDPRSPPTNATLYLATAGGGVWKTTNGGATWSPMSDNEKSLVIGALALAPAAPDILYAGTGEGNLALFGYTDPAYEGIPLSSYEGLGVLKTTDGGATWQLQGTAQFTGECFFRIAVHPKDKNKDAMTAFAATSKGLFRTRDGGATWVPLTNGLPAITTPSLPATDVVIDPDTPTTAYCAFWGTGVYQSTNALAPNPSWTKVSGIPTPTSGSIGRIALGISPSLPPSSPASARKVYALVAKVDSQFEGLYETVDGSGGSNWQKDSIAGAPIELAWQGAYNLNAAVHPATPDILYLSGLSLYRAVRTGPTSWTATDVGGTIHHDNHAIAFHPADPTRVYTGTDGGIYTSGASGDPGSWSDAANASLCLTQLQFIDQHPSSDAFVFGGTQDNGSVQFLNSVVFYSASGGDAGTVAIDQGTPSTVLLGVPPTTSPTTLYRSTEAGKQGTWYDAGKGLAGSSLDYPPFALNPTNQQEIVFGTDRLCLDPKQGTGGWPTKVSLPGTTGISDAGHVSAVSYVRSDLIYAATSGGGVYRAVRGSDGAWSATALQARPLPVHWIWDIAPLPTDANTIIVVLSGFGTPHVWRGVVAPGGARATWTDISGSPLGLRLPDIPVNALVVDPASTPSAQTFYIGTDIGVFRTTDGGVNWPLFNDGLPNVTVVDLKLHAPTRLLRAATYGRGLWERPLGVRDVLEVKDVNVYLRDHLMDTGWRSPSPAGIAAAFADPLQHVKLGDPLWWWMSPDVKVDAPEASTPGATPSYQMDSSAVNYLTFESQLAHRNPQRGLGTINPNRVYVQVHTRGIKAATGVTVKLLYASATPALPPLPGDFWTTFLGVSADTSNWKPIGKTQTVSVSPTRPTVVHWDWTPPPDAAEHSCFLVVADCPGDVDAIPTSSKTITDVGKLVMAERHVSLKNVHVVTVGGAGSGPGASVTSLDLEATTESDRLRVLVSPGLEGAFALVLPRHAAQHLTSEGLTARPLAEDQEVVASIAARLQQEVAAYEGAPLLRLDPGRREGSIAGLPPALGCIKAVLVFLPAAAHAGGSVTLIQEAGQQVLGGNTFVLRAAQHP